VSRACGVSVACVLTLLSVGLSRALGQTQDERAVRAAYVFNLTRYVEWPAGAKQLTIGILTSRETAEFLHKILDGKTADSRSLKVMLYPTDNEWQNCSILYMDDAHAKKLPSVLDKVGTSSVLTVGESSAFLRDGGMVALVRTGDKVQIQLNLEAARRSGIKLNPRLFDVARIITPETAHSASERKALQHPSPDYPAMAAKISLHGTVKFQVSIAPDGAVRRVTCLGGHPLLAEAAEKAIKNWIYETAPSETSQVVAVTF
jgi:TonB family protein